MPIIRFLCCFAVSMLIALGGAEAHQRGPAHGVPAAQASAAWAPAAEAVPAPGDETGIPCPSGLAHADHARCHAGGGAAALPSVAGASGPRMTAAPGDRAPAGAVLKGIRIPPPFHPPRRGRA